MKKVPPKITRQYGSGNLQEMLNNQPLGQINEELNQPTNQPTNQYGNQSINNQETNNENNNN